MLQKHFNWFVHPPIYMLRFQCPRAYVSNSTRYADFLKLGEAYETLKDSDKRRVYDLLHPRFKENRRTYPKPTPSATPFTGNPEQAYMSQEFIEMLAIKEAKRQRTARWSDMQKVYENTMSNLCWEIGELRAAIRGLEEIEEAEDAAEVAGKSWATWFLFPVYRKRVETEEETENKARERLHRLHSKCFKNLDLRKNESELRELKTILRAKREEFERANYNDDVALFMVKQRIWAKRECAQQEKERKKAAQWTKTWKEAWEKQQKEEAEELRGERVKTCGMKRMFTRHGGDRYSMAGGGKRPKYVAQPDFGFMGESGEFACHQRGWR